MTTPDSTIDDRWTSSVRPPLVTDLNGHGWSVVPHGTLTPAEEQRVRVSNGITNPLYDAALRGGLTRLQRRTADGSIDVALLHPRGAQALAGQLMDAAAQGLDVLVPPASQSPPAPMMTLDEIFGTSTEQVRQVVMESHERAELGEVRRAALDEEQAVQAGRDLAAFLIDDSGRPTVDTHDPGLAVLAKLRAALEDYKRTGKPGTQIYDWLIGQYDAHAEARRQELECERAEGGPKLEEALVRAVMFLGRQVRGGVLSLAFDTRPGPDSASTDEEWTAALTFGREAEDSDMAGGQGIGVSDVAVLALEQALDEVGA